MPYTFGVPADGDTGGTGDSPNTAMIVLYSITGIITALFLGNIITGAPRAHRHPERFGSRRSAGRVRQSRAPGIHRAMLDTIPVVKFDDQNDDVKATRRKHRDDHEPCRSRALPDPGRWTTCGATNAPQIRNANPRRYEHPAPTAFGAKAEMPDAGNYSCPICTDNFIKGQDLRILPCSRQFHMECIDPWLMNVSSTCPLCPVDANLPQTEDPEQTEENTDQPPAEGQILTTEDAHQQVRHMHRHLTNYLHGPLNARRMRDATIEERLAALRRVREANRGDSAPEGSHRGLTTRLRDRFRIRTRVHGAETETSVVADNAATSPAPAPPVPAHLTLSTA